MIFRLFLQCSTRQLVAQVSFVNLPACLFRMLFDSRTGQRIGPGEPSVACTGTGPYPACGVQDRTLILTTSHLGLDPIPHVPGTGPNPHYWAYSTTTRTRQTTTTIPFGLCLGQSSIAAARSIPGMCVCVHAWTWRLCASRGARAPVTSLAQLEWITTVHLLSD